MKYAISVLAVGFLLFLTAADARATQTGISSPAGSGNFGRKVTVLPNGNFVVVDTVFSEGGVNSFAGAILRGEQRAG